MPASQPFTRLCQQLARPRHAGRADLHLHSTASDGTYTPAEVIDLARRCGLAAVALTDHDTLAGFEDARAAAAETLEVIPAVEITCEYRCRELHLLGYFIDPGHAGLGAALAAVRRSRAERFAAMIERLRQRGVSLVEERGQQSPSLGRRHLAEMLVAQRKVGSVREAFQRYLGEGSDVVVPKLRLAVAEAIALVRAAGGVAAWAHPAYDGTRERLAELRDLGLGAVEVEYPDVRRGRIRELRTWADHLGLAVTGGSDCHGPGPRAVGTCTVSDEELALLRARAG